MSLTTVNGKPVTAAEKDATSLRAEGIDATATPQGIKVSLHKDECGEVGETGEHGDLGTNAK